MSRKSKRIQPLWKKYPVICAFIAIVVLALIIILPIGAATDWTFKFNNTSAPSKPTSAPSNPTSAPISTQPPPTSAPTSAPTSSPTPIPSNALTDANIRKAVEDHYSQDSVTKYNVVAKYGPFKSWDVSRVTNMRSLFENKRYVDDISMWNTSNVTKMAYMFQGAYTFDQDISKWNTSNVTSMQGMFYGAVAFNQNISNWDVSNVIDMNQMFYGAKSFNQPIQKWNTKSLETMMNMFQDATAFDQTLCWDRSQINTNAWNVNSNAKWC